MKDINSKGKSEGSRRARKNNLSNSKNINSQWNVLPYCVIMIAYKNRIAEVFNLATFGERFKELRLKKDLTQDQLVEEFNQKFNYNITKSAISQYENNKRIPEINLLIDLVQYFQVSLDFILCTSDLLYEERTKYDFIEGKDKMELEKIIEKVIFLVKSEANICVDGEQMNKKTKELFINCLQIGFELAKRNKKDK
jgi:transcriptional regulator with XRE-family HTH domain